MRFALWLLLSVAAVAQQRLEITIEKRDAGAWKVMDPGHVFQAGDQLRFRFKSNQPGYLYVVNEGSSGEQATLFPSEQAGPDNKIEPGREYMIPSTEGAFRVTGPKGYDSVYWVLSPVRIAEPVKYKPLPPPPAPNQVPGNLSPRCDDTILKARGECVDNGAGLKPNSLPGLTPRELFFVRKGDQSIVSIPAFAPEGASAGKPVVGGSADKPVVGGSADKPVVGGSADKPVVGGSAGKPPVAVSAGKPGAAGSAVSTAEALAKAVTYQFRIAHQ